MSTKEMNAKPCASEGNALLPLPDANSLDILQKII